MQYSKDDILTQLAIGEGLSLEFKELVFSGNELRGPKRRTLADEIAAFANGHGGVLILGVDDKTGNIVGIPLHLVSYVVNLITEVCHDAIVPSLAVKTEACQVPDSSGSLRWLLRIDIEKSLTLHRSPGGFYYRFGNTKRLMTPEDLSRITIERSRSRFIQFDDTAVEDAAMHHLDRDLIERFRTIRTEDDLGTLAMKLGMATRKFDKPSLTLAGVLLGTRNPEQWLPSAFIQAVAYRGTDIAEALDHGNYQIDAKDIFGPLDEQIAEACRFVVRNQRVSARKVIGREDRPQYDMAAVFEAVTNAVAHRDYSLQRSKIRIRMFADRIEVYSPGGLVNGLRIDQLPFRQASRNWIVTSLLSKCSIPTGISGLESSRVTIMDRRGEGVPVILQNSKRLSGMEPRYQLFGDMELLLTIFAAQ